MKNYKRQFAILGKYNIAKKEIIQEKEFLTKEEIKNILEKYNNIYGINIGFIEKEIGSRFSVKGNNLYMKDYILVGEKEMRAIIAHEIETHYLRSINGKKSKYAIFSSGTGAYLETEEGLAIYNQSKFITQNDKKYYSAFERYILLNKGLISNHDTFLNSVLENYNYDYNIAFSYFARLKRGIKDTSKKYIFSKDVIYVNGYIGILKLVESGVDLKELYFGKISIQDLDEIKKSDLIHLDIKNYKIPLFYN